jgi:hypothetical protein
LGKDVGFECRPFGDVDGGPTLDQRRARIAHSRYDRQRPTTTTSLLSPEPQIKRTDVREIAAGVSEVIFRHCAKFVLGLNYRLIAKVEYAKQTIYIKDVLSHKEYDKEKWKGGCGKKGH